VKALIPSFLIAACVTLFVCGCTVQGDPLFEAVDAGPAGGVPSEIADMLLNTCATAGCHSGSSPAAQLDLDPAVAEEQLVGVSGAFYANFMRIAPGDAANSLLVKKLKGDSDVGSIMPIGADPWSPDLIAQVEAWINAMPPDSGTPANDTTDSTDQDVIDDKDVTESDDAAETADQDATVEVAPVPAEVADIFAKSCGPCHVGEKAYMNPRLDADTAAKNLIGVKSGAFPDYVQVVPGDPDNSLLVKKLVTDGTDGIGGIMPMGSDKLPDSEIEVITEWIKGLAAPEGEDSK